MPNRVWCERGLQEPLAAVIPTSFFLSFFLSLYSFLFVSLIGLTDHRSFTYSPGGGRLRSLAINTVARQSRASELKTDIC